MREQYVRILVPNYNPDPLSVKQFFQMQSFAKDVQTYLPYQGWQLDKDIMHKGNKIYSPDNCCFVPDEINKLFIKSDHSRGKYPIGVTYHKTNNLFVARVTIEGKRKFIGNFDSIDEAFNAYKVAKEKNIKDIAAKWKEKIPKRLYDAMMNYQVEFTD